MMSAMNVLTVSQLNKYIKDLISKDVVLSGLWVKGEISNFKTIIPVISISHSRMKSRC